MVDTAKQKQLPHHGYAGGIIFDEMSIPEDIQLDQKRGMDKLCVCLFVCWSLTSLCHSNGHIETMPAR